MIYLPPYGPSVQDWMRQASTAVNQLAARPNYSGQIITAEMFGAVGDGVTDDGPAIQEAFDAGAKTVWLSYKNYVLATTVTLPANGALMSLERAVVTKGANIDMFDMSAQACHIHGLNIQGSGATYTGRGIVINAGASSYDQKISETDVLDMNGYALEFNGADAGARFRARDSNFCRTAINNAAVKLPSVSDTSGNRKFNACGTVNGGRLFDLDHGINTGIDNCDMVSFTMSSGTSRTRMSNTRVAALGGTITIDGYDNVISGGEIAGNIVLASTTQRCNIGLTGVIGGGTITDLSVATGDNMNYVYDQNGFSFTPVWGQTAGVGPSIGNGTITGRLQRTGRLYTVHIVIVMGSTTTYGDGTGDWTFSLPSPDNRTAKVFAQGTATATDATAGVYRGGEAIIGGGSTTITVRKRDTSTGWRSTVPHTWASGHSLGITIHYEVG